ncbi:hypothetical protein ACA910_007304 [Epithemia clementina (nom. ined.)]
MTDGSSSKSSCAKKCLPKTNPTTASSTLQGDCASRAAELDLQNKIVELMSRLYDVNDKIISMQSRLQSKGTIITNAAGMAKQKDKDNKELQEKLDNANRTIRAQYKMLASQNTMLTSLDEMISSTEEVLTLNDRKLQNKSEQLLNHCKKVDELKQQLAESKFKLPPFCQTRIDSQDIVSYIQKILENSCAKMSSTSLKSKNMFKHL